MPQKDRAPKSDPSALCFLRLENKVMKILSGVLAVSLEHSLAWTHIAYIKVFQYLHNRASSSIDKLTQHDLFRAILDAIHLCDPCHLIGGFEFLGHAFLNLHLLGNQFDPVHAGLVNFG